MNILHKSQEIEDSISSLLKHNVSSNSKSTIIKILTYKLDNIYFSDEFLDLYFSDKAKWEKDRKYIPKLLTSLKVVSITPFNNFQHLLFDSLHHNDCELLLKNNHFYVGKPKNLQFIIEQIFKKENRENIINNGKFKLINTYGYIPKTSEYSINSFDDTTKSTLIDFVKNYTNYLNHPKIGSKILNKEAFDLFDKRMSNSVYYVCPIKHLVYELKQE